MLKLMLGREQTRTVYDSKKVAAYAQSSSTKRDLFHSLMKKRSLNLYCMVLKDMMEGMAQCTVAHLPKV